MTEILASQKYMLQRMWRKSRILYFTTLFKAILDGIIPTMIVILSKFFVERLLAANWSGALFYIAIIFGLKLANLLISHIIGWINGDSYASIRRTMWLEIFEKTSNLDLALYEMPAVGTLYQEARGATQNGRCNQVLDSFFMILSKTITLISSVAILTMVQPMVLVVIIVVIIVQTYLVVIAKKQQYTAWKEDAKTNKEVSYCMGLLFDRSCANEMRLHSASSWIIQKYLNAAKKQDKMWEEFRHKQVINYFINNILDCAEEAFLYIFLAWQVIFKAMSFADFTMLFSGIKLFSSTVSSLIGSILDVGEISLYIESFKDYMELKNTIAIDREDDISIVKEEHGAASISLQNVSFKYPGSDQLVLSNINLEINPGKFYVIVGPNGAGKTTLINLLCRLYDPTEGEISLGGTNIKNFKYKEYRNLFGVVLQNYKVYDYSIAENVAMSEITDDAGLITKINACIAKAGLTNKVNSMPKGIHTRLGRAFDDNGVILSGGETQKVALAKALYRETPMLILDEPSSALDPFAENELIQIFNHASADKTVFYVSHRLSVAKYAYKVIFIEQGVVHGFAPHDELLKSCKRYAEMFRAQAKHYTQESVSELLA